jgi:hypothetical protein
MTYTATATVQIEEGWEIPMDLCTELSKIENIFERMYPYTFSPDFLSGGCQEWEWAEEMAVEGILNQTPYDDICRRMFDEYDPTPDYMPIGEMF